MLSATFAILLMSPFLMLRMSEGAGSFPKPLTAAEEQKYIELYMSGDMEARNVLIERNLRLVAHIIKKYYTQTSEQDDLISIGTIGLIKGISTYKPDRRVRLATYVSRCIENEILMYFRSLKKTAGDLSLSDSIDTDKDGNSLSLMEVISIEDDMLENLNARDTCLQLFRYINEALTYREAKIIVMRYGLDNTTPKTQREIAAICGISRSYVSRIEKKALEKLRRCFEEAAAA
jgi:RNA polymerase sporulation-specific sigma factor